MNDDGACGASEVATLGPPCLEGGSAAWLSTPTRGPLSPLPPCALLLVARNKVKNQPYSPCGGGLSYRVRPHVVFPPMGSTQKPGSVTVRLFYQPALAHMTGARGWPRPKPMGRPRLCLSGCAQGPPPWRRVTMGPKGGCTPEVVLDPRPRVELDSRQHATLEAGTRTATAQALALPCFAAAVFPRFV